MQQRPTYLFSIRSSHYIGQKIAKSYGQDLGELNVVVFSDGEFQPSFEQSIRGGDVFIIASTFPPADNMMELLLVIDAAKRASAHSINVVSPYFGFARQDRKDRPRAPIGAKLVANLLEATGATRVITMDLHADQIQGFFEVPLDHLYASSIFVEYIRENLGWKGQEMAFVSPDVGGAKRAKNYASYFGAELAMCYKERKKANEIDNMTLIGDVRGKKVILIDDIVDTATTLCKAADMIMEHGAKEVVAVITHPVLSGNAYEKINQSKLSGLVTTDSIPIKENLSSKIKVVSCASLFADVIHSLNDGKSINDKFILK